MAATSHEHTRSSTGYRIIMTLTGIYKIISDCIIEKLGFCEQELMRDGGIVCLPHVAFTNSSYEWPGTRL